MRPTPRPNGMSGATKSATVKKWRLVLWANQTMAVMTPIRPPWNDMPPVQILNK